MTLGFENENAKTLMQMLGIVRQEEFYCIPGEANVAKLREWEAALIAARKSLGNLEGWELFTQDIVQGERIGAVCLVVGGVKAGLVGLTFHFLIINPTQRCQVRAHLEMCSRGRGAGSGWPSRRSSPTRRSSRARTFSPRPTS